MRRLSLHPPRTSARRGAVRASVADGGGINQLSTSFRLASLPVRLPCTNRTSINGPDNIPCGRGYFIWRAMESLTGDLEPVEKIKMGQTGGACAPLPLCSSTDAECRLAGFPLACFLSQPEI